MIENLVRKKSLRKLFNFNLREIVVTEEIWPNVFRSSTFQVVIMPKKCRATIMYHFRNTNTERR